MLVRSPDDSVSGIPSSLAQQPDKAVFSIRHPFPSAETAEKHGDEYRASSYLHLRRRRHTGYFALVTAALFAFAILVLYHCRLSIVNDIAPVLVRRSLAGSEGGDEEQVPMTRGARVM